MNWPNRKPLPQNGPTPVNLSKNRINRTSASSGFTTVSVGGSLSRQEPKSLWRRLSSCRLSATFQTDWSPICQSVSLFQVRTDAHEFPLFAHAHRFLNNQHAKKYCWTSSDWRMIPIFSGPLPSWSGSWSFSSDIENREPVITAADTGKSRFSSLPTRFIWGYGSILHLKSPRISQGWFCARSNIVINTSLAIYKSVLMTYCRSWILKFEKSALESWM